MDLAAYLGLLGAWMVAIMSPGPDTVQLLRLGARSRRSALWAAVGICTGNVIWPVVTMAGLAALIAAFPWILTLLYLGGGAFLLWMGFGAFRGGRAALSSFGDATSRPQPPSSPMGPLRSWRLGLATNLSNPKALLFFGSVFAQFLPVGISLGERVAVLTLMTTSGLAWFCSFAYLVSNPAWAARLQRFNPWMEIIAGVVFMILGGFLIYEGVLRLF